jgi:hypothetical protein
MAYKISGSAVGIATGYGLGDRGVGDRVAVGSTIFTSPYCQTGSGVHTNSYSIGKVGRIVKLTTHRQLVPRSRKRGSIHPLFHTPSWSSA